MALKLDFEKMQLYKANTNRNHNYSRLKNPIAMEYFNLLKKETSWLETYSPFCGYMYDSAEGDPLADFLSINEAIVSALEKKGLVLNLAEEMERSKEKELESIIISVLNSHAEEGEYWSTCDDMLNTGKINHRLCLYYSDSFGEQYIVVWSDDRLPQFQSDYSNIVRALKSKEFKRFLKHAENCVKDKMLKKGYFL